MQALPLDERYVHANDAIAEARKAPVSLGVTGTARLVFPVHLHGQPH